MAYRLPDDPVDFPAPSRAWTGSGIRLPHDPADFGQGRARLPQSPADELDGLDYLIRTLPAAEMALDDLLIAERDLAATTPGGPPGFAKRVIARMEGEIDRRLGQAPDTAARRQAQAELTPVLARYRRHAVSAEQALGVAARVSSTEALLAAYLRAARADPMAVHELAEEGERALAALQKAGSKADAVAQRRAAFRLDLGRAAAGGHMELDGKGALQRMEDGALDDLIADTGERERLKRSARRFAKAEEKDARRAARRARDKARAEAQGARLVDKARREMAAEDGKDLAKHMARVRHALEGRAQLDAENAADRKAVDDHFRKALRPALAHLEAPARWRAEERHAQKLGILPAALINALKGDLLSGDALRAMRAASRIERLAGDERLLGQLAKALPAGELLRARAAAAYLPMGLPPARAMQRAEARLAQGARRSAPPAMDLRHRLGRAASMGRGGDTELGHLTPGERVVPPGILSPELAAKLDAAYRAAGLEPGRYTVGGTDDSINPATGAREFFLEGDPGEANPDFAFELKAQGADFTEADFTDADFGGTGLAPRPFPSGGSFDGLIQKTDFGAFNSLLGKSFDAAGTAWGAPRATPQAPPPTQAPGIPQAPALRSQAVETANQAAQRLGHDPFATKDSLEEYLTYEEAFLPSDNSGGNTGNSALTGGAGEDRLETGRRGGELPTVEESQSKSRTEQDDHLDELAERYHNIAKLGGLVGYDTASRHLKKFLRGDGGFEEVDSKWLRGYDVVNRAVEDNQKTLERKLFEKNEDLTSKLIDLKQGKPLKLDLLTDKGFVAPALSELLYASGSSTVETRLVGEATRDGDKILIKATINNRWHDTYNWHKGMKAYIPFLGDIKDSDALKLQEHRGAKPFEMESNWQQEFRATARVENGHLIIENMTWKDIP